MQLRLERQLNSVADEVSALTAVIRPILEGTLNAVKQEIVAEVGKTEDVKLKILPRIYRRGDGDCGICFEYAVHDAVVRGEASVLERVWDATTKHCKIQGSEPASILFGVEKAGSQQLIETTEELLTDESLLMYGTRGRPVKLKKHLSTAAAAFRRPQARLALPQSIRGLWKADLFLGAGDTDRWVGTTVKINRDHLEPARGLRIGVVPAREGRKDAITREGNFVVCPLPYDGAFMEIFYRGWAIIQQFIAADARLPREVNLPRPAERQVARLLEERRDHPVVDVIDALSPLAQPELLDTDAREAGVILTREDDVTTDAVVAPIARRPSSRPR